MPESIAGQVYVPMAGGGFSFHFRQGKGEGNAGRVEGYMEEIGNGKRRDFEDTKWSQSERKFEGKIVWGETLGGADSKWEYEIIFTEDFS